MTREARAGREGGGNQIEEIRGREGSEEKVGTAGERPGRGNLARSRFFTHWF